MNHRPPPPMRHVARAVHQRGQASAEYLVVTCVIAAALLAGSDTPPVTQLIAAFKSFFSAYTFALSLP